MHVGTWQGPLLALLSWYEGATTAVFLDCGQGMQASGTLLGAAFHRCKDAGRHAQRELHWRTTMPPSVAPVRMHPAVLQPAIRKLATCWSGLSMTPASHLTSALSANLGRVPGDCL